MSAKPLPIQTDDWIPPVQHDGNGEPRAADRGIVAELSDRIRATDHFAQDAGRRLQRFRGGVYVPDAEEHIRRRVLGLLRELRSEKRFSRNLCAEVSEHIRIQAPALWDRPPMETLNCANGLLDLQSRELRPHDPAHLSPVQIPVIFTPAATCDAWVEFIETTFPSDAAALGFEILACLMVPYMSLQKAVLAQGPGANGKSIYLSAVTSFIGRSNCAAMSLHSLEGDRFAAARLMGKLVNVCPDLPSAYLESTSVFKAIVGGDRIPAEYKFRDGFDFEPFARLLFSANHPPKSGDSSEGFFRRWVVIPFEKTFSHDQAGYVPRDVLLARLTAAAELSGVLNRALDALPQVLKRGFTDSESIRQAAEDFRAATDHFSVWLELETVEHPTAWVPMATLAATYNAACEQVGRPPMNRTQFGRALKRARSEVRDSRRMVDGRQVLGYQGVGLKQESEVVQ
jgi:putative DNA primase/helicase